MTARRGMGTSSSGCIATGATDGFEDLPSVATHGFPFCDRSDRIFSDGASIWLLYRDRNLHRSDEAVAPASQRLNVARTGSGIAQRLAHFVDGRIQAVVEVDKRIGGPKFLLQFFSRDHIAGAFQQERQHLERLPLQAQLHRRSLRSVRLSR